MLGAVSLNSSPPAAGLNLLQESADVDGDSQVGTDQFSQNLLEGIEVSEDSGCPCAISLVVDQFLDFDIVLDIALSAVPDIGRAIFEADSHEFLELRGRPFAGDSFRGVGENNVFCSFFIEKFSANIS